MIAEQRRTHKFVWLGLAVLLPVLMLLAAKDLDFTSQVKSNALEVPPVSIMRSGQSLKLQLNTSLKSSSSVVYEMRSDGSRGKVIGQLEGKGNYEFLVSEGTKGIYVMDIIKNVELLKMEW